LAKAEKYISKSLTAVMKFIPLSIKGVVLIEPDIYKDDRGFFFESYNQEQFKNFGINLPFVQDNQSCSKKNAIRGLHFQEAPYEQGKLVSVIKGSVRDIVVDLRENSSSFGKHLAVELDEHNKRMLWIPPGFAHGFSVFEENTIFFYKCTNFYHRPSENGIVFNDLSLNLDWGVSTPIVSEKDMRLMNFNEYKSAKKVK
jgi:dTDP-4-dehydrorhamnose 3,5-epimerase